MPDLVDIEETRWSEARRRADLIRPLLRDGRLSREAAQWASRELDFSERQIYTLARRCREEAGALTAFVIEPPSGGRGRSRLTPAQDTVIRELIETMLPDKRRFTNETIVREVRARCVREGIAPPSAATIRRRLKNAPAAMRRQRGEAVRCVRPLVGETPPAAYPLAAVQMDHTLADIILVDPVERLPIGRPWLTAAIDIFSRCVAGFHIDLESPSATTVGLCLTHIATDKAAWLADRGIDAEWPLQGKPEWIGVDNAREFKSQAFQRGCDQHGIVIAYRPPGQPHYGGVVERVLGTMMGLVHEAPGTTRSNPQDRGSYDSQGKACLTLEEFEHFLGVAIAQRYHYALHHGLNAWVRFHAFKH